MNSTASLGGVELSRIVAGRKHAPVVYFARMGDYVKIGTSTNLKARMKDLYLSLKDVLLVVPGDRDAEDAFHEQFADSRVQEEERRELFRLDWQLRSFLNPRPPAAHTADPERPLITLREACEAGVLKSNLTAARKAAQRTGFPKAAGWAEDGVSAVYRSAELAEYQNGRILR